MSIVPNHRGPIGLKGERIDPPRRNKSPLDPNVSKAIRDSARGEECTLRLPCCNRDPDTTVLAHIRLPGDGIGIKPPDWFAIYACSACHDALDRRNGITAGMWGFEDLLIALRRTQEKLARKGLMRI